MPCGFLNLLKPPGSTSRAVVDLVQRLVRPAKAGHAGTLDPLATGVLVVAVGQGTRLIEHVQRMPKTYRGTFLLGRSSPTDDIDGEVVPFPDGPEPPREAVLAAAARMRGTIEQVPPAFSALKIEGRRAYDLARRGEPVVLKPRKVEIHRLDVLRYAYPELELELDCSGGTYVRAIGRDLALALGTRAVMSRLTRSAIGSFRAEDACDPEVLTPENWPGHLHPLLRAVEELPGHRLSGVEYHRIRDGLAIDRPPQLAGFPEVAALDETGRLVAILVPRQGLRMGPKCYLRPDHD